MEARPVEEAAAATPAPPVAADAPILKEPAAVAVRASEGPDGVEVVLSLAFPAQSVGGQAKSPRSVALTHANRPLSGAATEDIVATTAHGSPREVAQQQAAELTRQLRTEGRAAGRLQAAVRQGVDRRRAQEAEERVASLEAALAQQREEFEAAAQLEQQRHERQQQLAAHELPTREDAHRLREQAEELVRIAGLHEQHLANAQNLAALEAQAAALQRRTKGTDAPRDDVSEEAAAATRLQAAQRAHRARQQRHLLQPREAYAGGPPEQPAEHPRRQRAVPTPPLASAPAPPAPRCRPPCAPQRVPTPRDHIRAAYDEFKLQPVSTDSANHTSRATSLNQSVHRALTIQQEHRLGRMPGGRCHDTDHAFMRDHRMPRLDTVL